MFFSFIIYYTFQELYTSPVEWGFFFGGGGGGFRVCLGFLQSFVIQLYSYFCYKLELEGCGQLAYRNISHLSRYSCECKEFRVLGNTESICCSSSKPQTLAYFTGVLHM